MNRELYKNYRGVRITKTIPMSVKLDLDIIKSLLDQELGADIFIKTRKREYVDARRVFVAIVYDKYDLVTNWGGGVPSGHALKVLISSMSGRNAPIKIAAGDKEIVERLQRSRERLQAPVINDDENGESNHQWSFA